ncbi:Uncharacterised protein [Salmonella enterica subsp. indica]|uniref:Uncharacterized protein n=1 Tax=Salmonella enterica subsp. indica TaxID=59207 RepID=A0A379XLD6_SALER|nr:Uncharacterised protein [Salmonella enterica subsp. indica]
MSSITGRANFLLTTSTGGGIQMGVKCRIRGMLTNNRLYYLMIHISLLPHHLTAIQQN